jgi:hypothetical protein
LPLASLAVGVAIMLLTSAALSWRARRKVLERIRKCWEHPRQRARPMEAIESYSRSRTSSADAIDDRTWHDLNMDDMFARLDRTESTIGQQLLYHRLRSANSPCRLAAFEAMVSLLTIDSHRREQAQLALSRLQDPAGYDLWALTQPDTLERGASHLVFAIVSMTMLMLLGLAVIWPGLLLVAVALTVVNIVIRFHFAVRLLTLVGPFRQISGVIAVAETIVALFEADKLTLLETLGDDVRALSRLKRIVRVAGRAPSASGDLTTLLMDYLNLVFLLDVNALYFAARELERSGAALLRVIEAVGDVDASIAIASYRAGTRSWTRPVFMAPGSAMRLEGLIHPLLETAVANSLVLESGDGALITGSNMSGKTTFVRAVGVNALLGQTINTVFAECYEAPHLRVRSCIGSADDVLAGTSYYLAELQGVLRLVHDSVHEAPHLFLLDELFRGTNAVERVAGAEAVLRELLRDGSGRRTHYVLAATHDAEVVELLSGVYTAFHFGDRVGDMGLTFDYTLRPGLTATRNALALLRLHGAPATMVTRALERAALLDRARATTAREP